ncbi:MAG: carboxylating nicotinate-nucleotide diphosphorylase [Actinomycetota bacterium]
MEPDPVALAEAVRVALAEDLGHAGDITTKAIVRIDQPGRAHIVAKSQGLLAGVSVASQVFSAVDKKTTIVWDLDDGDTFAAGDTIAQLSGRAMAILAAERVALNFLQHLSGVATSTRRFVDICEPFGVKVLCTRKTLPGLRDLQRYAIVLGGGHLHRKGLFDAILIKTNHGKLAASLTEAVRRAKAGSREEVEVEAASIQEVEEALAAGAEKVLLDNADVPTIAKAVEITRGKAYLEVSGGIDLELARQIAPLQPDAISVGRITHSVEAIDFSLQILGPAGGAPIHGA